MAAGRLEIMLPYMRITTGREIDDSTGLSTAATLLMKVIAGHMRKKRGGLRDIMIMMAKIRIPISMPRWILPMTGNFIPRRGVPVVGRGAGETCIFGHWLGFLMFCWLAICSIFVIFLFVCCYVFTFINLRCFSCLFSSTFLWSHVLFSYFF